MPDPSKPDHTLDELIEKARRLRAETTKSVRELRELRARIAERHAIDHDAALRRKHGYNET